MDIFLDILGEILEPAIEYLFIKIGRVFKKNTNSKKN